MTGAFGDAVTVPASQRAKKQMKQLVAKGIFNEQRDVWRMGASLGIATSNYVASGKRETFQNVNSLDPDEIFAAVMMGLYPQAAPEDRLKKLVDHAEWGIDEIFRRIEIGTIDWPTLGLLPTKPGKSG